MSYKPKLECDPPSIGYYLSYVDVINEDYDGFIRKECEAEVVKFIYCPVKDKTMAIGYYLHPIDGEVLADQWDLDGNGDFSNIDFDQPV